MVEAKYPIYNVLFSTPLRIYNEASVASGSKDETHLSKLLMEQMVGDNTINYYSKNIRIVKIEKSNFRCDLEGVIHVEGILTRRYCYPAPPQ